MRTIVLSEKQQTVPLIRLQGDRKKWIPNAHHARGHRGPPKDASNPIYYINIGKWVQTETQKNLKEMIKVISQIIELDSY